MIETPEFLEADDVLQIYEAWCEVSLDRHSVIRDIGLLESALGSVINTYYYDPMADLFDLAATYAVRIIKNHPFIDGNKRTGMHTAIVFLEQHGVFIPPAQQTIIDIGEDIAADRLSVENCAAIFRAMAA